MTSRNKVLLALLVVGLPVMFAFQNCAKTQSFEMTDDLALGKSAPVDTEQLPSNTEVSVDENNNVSLGDSAGGSSSSDSGSSSSDSGSSSSDSGSSSSDSGSSSSDSGSSSGGESSVGTQIEDPNEELQDIVNESIVACEDEASFKESSNPMPKPSLGEDGKYSIEKVKGVKVLSSADFNGASKIASVSNSGGQLVLCGLEVDETVNTHGHLILYNSKVSKVNVHHGKVILINGSAVIDSSNAKIYKLEGE